MIEAIFVLSSDFNECAGVGSTKRCPLLGSECVNTLGSYYCTCPAGYLYDDSSKQCTGLFKVNLINTLYSFSVLNTLFLLVFFKQNYPHPQFFKTQNN